MANILVDYWEQYRNGREVVFIVTGGYKAMTSIASIVAMITGCQTYYSYEHSNVPGNIGILPLAIAKNRLPRKLFDPLLKSKFDSGILHKELKELFSKEEICRYFSKEGTRYYLSPVLKLAFSSIDKLPVYSDDIPILFAEANLSHHSIWGINIKHFEDIPDPHFKEIVNSIADAVKNHAQCLHLGEFGVKKTSKDSYSVSYCGSQDGIVALKVHSPLGWVRVACKPNENSLQQLDRLCCSLWGKR